MTCSPVEVGFPPFFLPTTYQGDLVSLLRVTTQARITEGFSRTQQYKHLTFRPQLRGEVLHHHNNIQQTTTRIWMSARHRKSLEQCRTTPQAAQHLASRTTTTRRNTRVRLRPHHRALHPTTMLVAQLRHDQRRGLTSGMEAAAHSTLAVLALQPRRLGTRAWANMPPPLVM